MKLRLLILLLLISNFIFSQKAFENWDKNYILSNPENIINAEIDYAKNIEKDTTQGHFYVAMSKFRFLAEFTGNKRPIDSTVFYSMKVVLKVKLGSSEALNGLVSQEFEFDIGESKIWMPIQNPLIEDFEKEVKKGDKVLLYTLFTNEHKFKGGIINTFLISEFATKWTE